MNKQVGLARLGALVRRRKWPILITTLAAGAAGLYSVKTLPPVWQARAVVRIDDPHPSKDYVAPIVAEPDAERLKGARLAFLAQPIVAEAADKLKMLPPPEKELARRQLLGGLTARIDARLEGADTYVLTFEDDDAARARAFLGALTEAFASRRTREAAIHAREISAFFDREVEALRPRVSDVETQVEKFRAAHYGALPDQLDSSLRLIEETELEAHTVSESMDLAMGRRRDLIADVYSPLRHQEEEVAKDLSLARTRYTGTSPEVKSLEGELERVRVDRESDEGMAARRLRGSGELKAVDMQIQHMGGELGLLRSRETDLRSKVNEVARNADQMIRLTLDRDVLRDRLRILVGKQEEAQLAAAMEAGDGGKARVNIVEPAWVGANPIKPSKPMYAMLALALAFGLGLGVGALCDALDRRVRTTAELHDRLVAIPMLGVVPRIVHRSQGGSANEVH